jgi:transcriptional regulator with XRE-family HTH domain
MGKGAKIRRLREEHGLTQAQLASLVGVTDAALRGYESGRRIPKRGHLLLLADALGVAPESLVDHGLEDPDAFAHAIFDLEGGRAVPALSEGPEGVSLSFDGVHGRVLRDWFEVRSRLESGEMSQDEYDSWRDGYVVNGEGDKG